MALKASGPAPRILHLFPAFDPEPHVLCQVRLINALGRRAEHAVVSDDRERRGAARLVAGKARLSWPAFPPLAGSKLPGRLMKLSAAMAGYDLICTHGAGALDAAFAHTLFADVHKLPPLVHHEHGHGAGERGGRRRAWYRRFALGRTAALVVPDRRLEAIALADWAQPRGRVRMIPGGIDTRAFAGPAARDALPGLVKRREERWLGAFADATGDDPAALIRALAQLPAEWQLVVAGEGAHRAALEQAAEALEIEDRLHFAPAAVLPGGGARPELLALLDLLALPDAEAHPERVIEAMAAGLAIVAPHGGEAVAALASDNGPLLAEPGDERDFAAKLRLLATRQAERKRIGQANREKARAEFDEQKMVERHWALYRNLLPGAPPAE